MTDHPANPLADRYQIIENLARYHHAVDAKDWQSLTELFAPNATAEYRSLNGVELFGLEGAYDGRDAIVRWIQVGQEPFNFNGAPTHFMTNHVVDVRGDSATSRSSFCDFDLPTGLVIGTGIYSCSHQRGAHGWQITQMLLEQRLCDAVIDTIQKQRQAATDGPV